MLVLEHNRLQMPISLCQQANIALNCLTESHVIGDLNSFNNKLEPDFEAIFCGVGVLIQVPETYEAVKSFIFEKSILGI